MNTKNNLKLYKMSIFPMFTYRFITISIKVTGCFGENDKLILKCMMAKIDKQQACLYIFYLYMHIFVYQEKCKTIEFRNSLMKTTNKLVMMLPS